jgi:hypothetical protein
VCRRMSRSSPAPAASSPLPMASSNGVWEPVNGRVPGVSGELGAVLVTVKVALQMGGLVVNW